jgi:tRNA pseudouridine13 synthase
LNQFEVKHVPDDFLVRESVVVRLAPEESATHRLFLLRKRGYTTMEAVRAIAAAAGVAETSLGYCGLKDEDGVTEQLISAPAGVPVPAIAEQDTVTGGRWYTTQHYGFTGAALRVGQMEGNSFKIILRNVAPEHVTGFFDRKKINFMFLNYFDTQRFGVPNGPHRTHLVGAAMLEGRWEDARKILIELNAPESELAASWPGSGRDFFFELDGRVRSFYPAAQASFAWNDQLAALAAAAAGADVRRIAVDGIGFTYVTEPAAAARVMAEAYELPIVKYRFDSDTPTRTTSVRTTVAQTVLEVDGRADDEYFPGRKRVELSFFLPSGSYATAAIRQLAAQIS